MNLRDIASQTLEKFDARNDNPNQQEDLGLPEGTYDVVINKAGHRVYDSGYTAVNVVVEVVAGEHTGRKEFINIPLEADFLQKHKFLLERNIKLIGQLAYVTGTELTDEDWESEEQVGQAFRHTEGKQFMLNIEKSTGKKGKTYTNYSFEPYEEDIVITDEDMPF